MPTYTYSARDIRGRSRAGAIDAQSEREAAQKLREEGLTVTSVRLTSALADIETLRTRQAARHVKREDIITFSAQLSVMLETGVPLSEALSAVQSQAKQGSIRRIVEIVSDRINSGVSFSGAISEFPRAFPPLMIALIRASEATGALGSMLARVAEYLGKDRRTVRQIRGALTYPALMLGMAIVVTIFLVAWVLPRFARIYATRQATLPKPTQVLLTISQFLQAHWVSLLIAVIVLGVALALWKATTAGRRAIDWARIRLPIIGSIYTSFYIARSMRTLGTLLSAGVTLTDAVGIVRDITNNVHWRAFWDELNATMTQGRPLSDVVLDTSLLPSNVSQMIAAGERTGKLPEVLERIADVAQQDLDESIRGATQLIEPLVISVMGLLIGGIAIALLLPIFTMGSAMGR